MNVSSGSNDIWLPALVGFMAGRALDQSRPVYLQGYQNPTTPREREDRQVVAGGHGGGGSVIVGSFHGGSTGYVPGTLSSGMSNGASRAGFTTASLAVAGRPAVAAPSAGVSAAARGGFGAAGAGAAGS